MGKLLIRFVSPRFEIEESTLVRWRVFPPNPVLAFSTFPLRSNVAEIEIEQAGRLQGSLTDIVLRRATNGISRRINLCSFSEEITSAAIRKGEFEVDLTPYKEVVLRVRGNQQVDANPGLFNVLMLESDGPTFDLPMNSSGETSLLARSGQYIVSAVVGTKAVTERFDLSPDEAEPKILEFNPF